MLTWLKDNHQALTGLGAMLVGIAALFVAWDQSRVMRAQQHGAVVPVVQMDGFLRTLPEQRSMGLRFHNSGVGPAMIETIEVLRDGAPTQEWGAIELHLPDEYDVSWSSVVGRVLAPNGEVEPIAFHWSRDALDEAGFTRLREEWARWDLRICYCSVFERCWTSYSASGERTAVQECPAIDYDPFAVFGRVTPSETVTNQ